MLTLELLANPATGERILDVVRLSPRPPIQAKPQDAVFHKNLGAAWLARGEVERALGAWNDAFRLAPTIFESEAIGVPRPATRPRKPSSSW